MSGNDDGEEGPADDRHRSAEDPAGKSSDERTGTDSDIQSGPDPDDRTGPDTDDRTKPDDVGQDTGRSTDGVESTAGPADDGAPDEAAPVTVADRSAESEDRPNPQHGSNAAADSRGPVRWLLTTEREDVAAVRELLGTVATVLLLGVLLFAISGIWPPLVAVESGSMEPHMSRGDLVFIVDEHRFSGENAVAGTGVVTWRTGTETGYWSFGNYGNVIVFEPDGSDGTPIIHRARFWVEKDENWIDSPSEGGTGKADLNYLTSGDDCSDYPETVCPAPNDGFITKGDANGRYDQVVGRSRPVKPEWIRGTAKVRVPYLGWVRLTFSGR